MDLKTAYQLLGLPEDATREMVEKRYDLLLKQERRRRREAGEDGAPEDEQFTEATRAYRFIIEEEDRKAVSELTERQYGKYKQFAGTAAKLDHWVSYYKWHALGVIAAIGLIIYGVVSYIDHREEQARLAALPPVDMEATFAGQFFTPDRSGDTSPAEEAMLQTMPGWKRIELSMLTFSMNAASEMDIALQQKAMVMLATERPDVYFMDKDTYPWVARTGVLLELDDEAAGRLAAWLPEGAALTTQGDEESGAHVYGIDLTGSPLLKDIPIVGERFIVGIRRNAERPDKALEFIETYLKARAASAPAPAQ